MGAVQVEKHDSRESVWFVHDGKVYDGTKFLKEHPGGAESILMVGGQDATEEFNAIHSSKAKSMLADYMIGQVGNAAEAQDDVAPERAPIDKQVSQYSLTFAMSKVIKNSIILQISIQIDLYDNGREYSEKPKGVPRHFYRTRSPSVSLGALLLMGFQPCCDMT